MVGAAVNHYRNAVQAGDAPLPTVPKKTSPRDLAAASDKVESTYLIRMWAEFETALRSYRRYFTRDLDDRINTSNLSNWTAGVKQGRAISEYVRDNVHEVLNIATLVHERNQEDPPAEVAIDVARAQLNNLLHCLPIKW